MTTKKYPAKKPNKSARGALRPGAKDFAPAIKPSEDQVVDLPRLLPDRLIDKDELLHRVPVTYPTIWKWMQEKNFPRSRNIGGKSAWLEHEVEAWIRARPLVPIKGEHQQKVEA